MPEHVHLLLGEPATTLLSKAIQALKLSLAYSPQGTAFLEPPLLRLQCLFGEKAARKTQIHAPEPSEARLSRRTVGVGMAVQLQPHRHRRTRHRRDRVASGRQHTENAKSSKPMSQKREMRHPHLWSSSEQEFEWKPPAFPKAAKPKAGRSSLGPSLAIPHSRKSLRGVITSTYEKDYSELSASHQRPARHKACHHN